MRNMILGFTLTAIAFFGLGWYAHRPYELSVPMQVAQAAVATATQSAARAETVFVHDTLRFARLQQHYDTVKSVLNVHDTVAVERFIAVADSTIQTCATALSSCSATVTAKDSVIATQGRLIVAALADHPSRVRIMFTDLKWGALGYAAGRLTPHVPVPLLHLTF